MKPSRSHSIALSILLLALFVPVGLAQDDVAEPKESTKPVEHVVTLLERGAEPRVRLRLRPKTDAIEATEMIIRTSMKQSMQGMQMPPQKMPPMRLVIETKTDDVAANGDLTYIATYKEAEAQSEPGVNPMMRQQMNATMRTMLGLKVRGVLSDRGIPRKEMKVEHPAGDEDMMQEQLEGVTSFADRILVPLPEEAIGVGGKWKVESTSTQQGMTIKQTVIYTVTSIAGDTLELDAEAAQHADPQEMENSMMPPGASMRLLSFTGEGSGKVKINLSKVMPTETRLRMKNDMKMSMTMNGQTQEMQQELEMDLRAEAVEPAAQKTPSAD